MKKEKVSVGDIFLIPFENQFAVCKVLWISERTRNVFSFIIKNRLIAIGDNAINSITDNDNVKIKLFTGIEKSFILI